jgi:methylmalonyl-CoA/ethylmalonyl-CoA epimerase
MKIDLPTAPPLPVDHIGISVEDLAAAIKFYSESFGLKLVHQETLVNEKIDVAFLENGASLIELITSNDPNTALGRSLQSRGPGLHHICFRTTDIKKELSQLAARGHKLIDSEPRIGSREKLIAFLHPQNSQGVLIELCQVTGPQQP